MKIAIFGGTGPTGQHLVEQALEQGHEVRVLVRNPEKLKIRHERLELVQGDARDAATVDRLIQSTDGVLSALGHVRGGTNDPQLLSTAAGLVIAAMKKHGVRRLIWLTGAGVPDPNDRPNLMNRLVKALLLMLARPLFEDSERAVSAIRASDLDWTLARAPRLTDAPAKGTIRVGYAGVGTGMTMSRADVATFMLRQLQRSEWLHKAPMISN
ncbi:MAG: NAD(P)-dependent oxidoreductase [Bacillota bacterium]